ncbi:uncharacterized protein SRS1_12822 [Sporisorium reilianum f. sp. reilianum]|uniref:Uncharacterized protein n=1 Tax=Sporisorium reilianum f. sp. reilianum TaxID=72559 RepID=A0A2N8UAS8_9BASI|nr:uncharacterized protein SRS1_12822 [Sporisorium reilianum f. sp. reilianum]
MMDRHYPPQPSYDRSKVPSGSKGPAKASVSTILESAKRIYSSRPALSLASSSGPLLGNTLNSNTSSSVLAFPSSPGAAPPVEPSLFAYSSSSAANKSSRSLKNSNASIHTAQTRKSTRTKSTERVTIRNARGEIEWKDPPPVSSSRHLAADSDGFHTADDDDLEAREWERKRERQMEADRLDVYRRQQAREEAQRRRIEAEKAAEEERIRKEKESAERRAKRKQLAEERRKREEEEAARQAQEEAERKEQERLAAIGRKKREEEEAIRRAEEERLAAIEAERLAKEEAIRAAREAVLEKERQLVEAKRQVDEKDRAARRAGRREDRRAQRALAAGFPPGEVDPDAQQTDDEEDDEAFVDDDTSDAASEVFVDAGTEDDLDAEAKSATTDSMARSTSNLDAPSSTDGSSDMPATPADEKSMSIMPPNPSSTDLGRKSSSNGGHGQVKFAAGTNGEATPTAASTAEKIAPYKSDRFRNAVKVGARRTAPAAAAAVDSSIVPSTSLLSATFASSEGDEDEEGDVDGQLGDDEIVQPQGPYRKGGITYGRGWCAHGLADPSLTIDHRRYVRVPRAAAAQADTDASADAAATRDFDEVMYSDLGELIWSATTPDVIARLISHLDYADVKALRQTSQSIRFALGQLAGREIVLARFLSCVGYEAWTPTEVDGKLVDKDPYPLSFSDCEAFLLSFDLMPEYALVGAEYARAPHKMDPRYPRLARATTRAYNRVLTRLRMQPHFRVPSPSQQQRGEVAQAIKSPWKPGRAGFFRAWVPSQEAGGWLSDTELARCERELFIAGVLPHLQKGDVVWDCAVGDERNEGKYIFDGRYLRDLSFMFDRAGHLPSWLNAFQYAPSYYHNIVRSSDAAQPVVYLDVLPWRDQIVASMRLVQDQVETFAPHGARYRISKWLYRAVVTVVPGTIISDEGVAVVDAGWHGKIVIETEGTAEHAKELISRCAGPAESAHIKARLLASVMDADASMRVPKAPAPTRDEQGKRVETTSPWAIVRARSRPGLIWVRPMDMRERVVF